MLSVLLDLLLELGIMEVKVNGQVVAGQVALARCTGDLVLLFHRPWPILQLRAPELLPLWVWNPCFA